VRQVNRERERGVAKRLTAKQEEDLYEALVGPSKVSPPSPPFRQPSVPPVA